MRKPKIKHIIIHCFLAMFLLSIMLPIFLLPSSNNLVYGEEDVGYTFIRKIGSVFHIWNNLDNYYINETGIQLTNHFGEYWSKNIWGLRVRKPSGWHVKWADGLNWNWMNETDSANHWVELNGTATYSQGTYSAIFRVRYYLGDGYKRINMSLGLKNTGTDIEDLDFGWLTKNIQIGGDVENDVMEVTLWADVTNHTKGYYQEYLNLSESIDESWNEQELAKRQCFIQDAKTESSLELLWDQYGWKDGVQKNLTYRLIVNSSALPKQKNVPSLLFINIGQMNSGQTAYTNFWWIDATTIIQNATANGEIIPRWFSPQNAYESDNLNASASSASSTSKWYNYGFQDVIPEGNVIDKVEIGVEYSVTESAYSLSIEVTGSNQTDSEIWFPQAFVSSLTEELVWIDATTITDWTRDKLNDTNFKVKVKYNEGGGCFARDTLVTMADGSQVPIQLLRIGDELLTYNNKKQVVTKFAAHKDERALMFHKVILENDVSIIVYGKLHNIPINRNLSVKLVKDIVLGDLVFYENRLVEVVGIETLYLTEFYNIEVSKSLLYANGILIHNAIKVPFTGYLDWLPVRVTYSVAERYVTFYYHACGTILVDGELTANGTQIIYNPSDTFNLTAVPSETRAFLKHVYDSSESYENPLIFTVDGNYTFHTWFARYESFNPSVKTLIGSTTQTSGVFPDDIEANDGNYKVFQSAVITQPYDAEDFVDDNTTDVDTSDSIGTHSNFTAMQYSDGNYDTITDENAETPHLETLYIESWTNVIDEWTRVGANPYLDVADQPSNYIHVSAKSMEEGDFYFANIIEQGYNYTFHSIDLYMYCDAGSELIYATLYDGSGWSGDYTFQGSGWAWRSIDVSAFLDNKFKIDAARLHLESVAIGGFSGSVAVDAAYLRINMTSNKWLVELELQFTNVPYDKENEYLCIKTGTRLLGEDLGVRGWTGSSWNVIDSALTWSTWNNYSVSSFITSNTFTIQLLNTDMDGETWWNIDAVLIHLWQNGEYNATIEFEGSSNAETWQKFNWTLDAAVTNASVSVTYQLYNYTEGAYASSGLGYISYTSSATPNTDELKWQQMNTTDCIDFRNGADDWKLKVEAYSNPAGMGNTTLQHEIKIDWIQFTPYWFCIGIEVGVREIIFLFVACIFFSGYYEFNKDKVWSAILGAGLWIVISLLWIIRSADLWIFCLIFSGLGIFYILRVVLSLLEMKRLRQRGLGNGNVSV